MAKFQFDGVDELVSQYKQMGVDADEMIRRAVWEGAKVVADGIKSALESLPVDDSKFDPEGVRRSVNSAQKQGLIDGMGISKMKDDEGMINVKVGVSGRNKFRTRTNPGGQLNASVARSLEHGASYMQKNPVFSKTAKALKKSCEQAMQDSLDRDYKAIE